MVLTRPFLSPTVYFLVKCAPFIVAAVFVLNCCHQSVGQAPEQAKTQTAPTKQLLIDNLKALFPLLKNKDFENAKKHFALPPDFKPEMLDGMIERNEISMAGIELLETDAKFGKAADLFGADRAGRYAKQADVELDKCYGFYHQANSAAAEVIALWNDTEFKIIRLDDVGKIAGTAGAAPQPVPSAEEAAKTLPALKAAVEANSEDVTALARYAMALFQAGKLSESWVQLMTAYNLQPYHGGIERGIEICLNEFEKRGVLAANIPIARLESVLGPPQRSVDLLLLGRKRLVYAFLAVDCIAGTVYELIDLRGATNVLFEPKEKVVVDLKGLGWLCGYRKKSKRSSLSKYYPPNQSMTEWTESVEVERILGAAKAGSLEKIVETMMGQIKKLHPDASHNILESDGDSAIVGVVIPARPEHKFEKRYQLIRLMKGADDVHRLAYTIKSDKLSSETEKKWLEIVKSASLTPAKSIE